MVHTIMNMVTIVITACITIIMDITTVEFLVSDQI